MAEGTDGKQVAARATELRIYVPSQTTPGPDISWRLNARHQIDGLRLQNPRAIKFSFIEHHAGKPRHIRGGRGKVRIALYQAAVAAIRYCPVMKAFYAALKARGKASKVALIAVARKLLVLANALVRTMKRYELRANSVCPQNP